jgi:hypothetical protein
MGDIKNLFADTFKDCDLSQFPKSDLRRLGIKRDIKECIKKQQKSKLCCPLFKNAVDEEDVKFLNRNKIIPRKPNTNNLLISHDNKYIRNKTTTDKKELKRQRQKVYYYRHREELKYKRLIKEGRYDVIERLLKFYA